LGSREVEVFTRKKTVRVLLQALWESLKLEFWGEGFEQVLAAFQRMSQEKEAIFHQQ
jgi:hypothetical protein